MQGTNLAAAPTRAGINTLTQVTAAVKAPLFLFFHVSYEQATAKRRQGMEHFQARYSATVRGLPKRQSAASASPPGSRSPRSCITDKRLTVPSTNTKLVPPRLAPPSRKSVTNWLSFTKAAQRPEVVQKDKRIFMSCCENFLGFLAELNATAYTMALARDPTTALQYMIKSRLHVLHLSGSKSHRAWSFVQFEQPLLWVL
mmetsp:Transcript_10448/g.23669  ORF Transcript_10448/g.23669 Transcript_10448/m.23669 type:complete len:200 (+) Transcript_10448:717-1316(+)